MNAQLYQTIHNKLTLKTDVKRNCIIQKQSLKILACMHAIQYVIIHGTSIPKALNTIVITYFSAEKLREKGRK